MLRCLFASLLAGWLLCSVGCEKTNVSDVSPTENVDLKLAEADEKKHDHPHADDPKIDTTKLKRERAVPTRENLSGRWVMCGLQVVQPEARQQMPQYGDVGEMILNVNWDEKDSTASSITIVATKDGSDHREMKINKLDGSDIEFECHDTKTEKKLFDFQGHFHHGRVLGSFTTPGGEVIPVRLIPTDERTFARIPGFDPLEETPRFLTLMQSAVPEEDVKELSKEFPVSPMTRVSYLGVLEMFSVKKVAETEIDNLINDFVASQKNWGTKLQAQSRFDAAVRLIVTGYDVSHCEKLLEAAVKEFAEVGVDSEGQKARFASLREAIKFRSTLEMLDSKSSAKQEEGRQHAVGPFQDVVGLEPPVQQRAGRGGGALVVRGPPRMDLLADLRYQRRHQLVGLAVPQALRCREPTMFRDQGLVGRGWKGRMESHAGGNLVGGSRSSAKS